MTVDSAPRRRTGPKKIAEAPSPGGSGASPGSPDEDPHPWSIDRRIVRNKAVARMAARHGGARVERPVRAATKPTVSVVIPCYNYGRFLPECVASVLSQDGVRIEVIVVDDASPDGSGEVAERLSTEDDRVRTIRHRRNLGHIATYNDGLAAVSGDYVLLLSADDLLVPGALSRATALMEHRPEVGLVYGRAATFENHPLPAVRTDVTYWAIWPGPVWLERRYRLGQNTLYSPTAVLRAEVQRRIGGYDPSLPHAGDLQMWLRAAAVSDVGFVGGAHQAFYRWHQANMSALTYRGDDMDIRQRHEAFRSVIPCMPADLGTRLGPLADRALAERALHVAAAAASRGDHEEAATFVSLALEVDRVAYRLDAWSAPGFSLAGHNRSPLHLARVARDRLLNHLMWEQTHWYGG